MISVLWFFGFGEVVGSRYQEVVGGSGRSVNADGSKQIVQ